MTPLFAASLHRQHRSLPGGGKRRAGAVVFVAAVMGLAVSASACSVPVFRYALEHWESDPYRLTVFHRGPLSAEEEERLASLSQRLHDPDGRRLANLELVTVDLSKEVPPEVRTLWEQQSGETLPVAVLQRPGSDSHTGAVVCRGPLQEAFLERVFDSPLRQTIAAQLLEGESIVWVLLESGDAARDEAAFSTLTSELKRLAETLRLPAIDPADAADLSLPPETLKISFVAHRLSREDEREEVIREMLLSVEPDLRDDLYRGEPMAFPIFGRGRVLYTLIGEGIHRDTIEEACRFLTAGCQCTVKRENPGIDLLFAVAWSRYVEPTVPLKPLPPLVGLAGFGEEGNISSREGNHEASRLADASAQEAAASGDVLLSQPPRNGEGGGPGDEGIPTERVSGPGVRAAATSPVLYAVLGVVMIVLGGTVFWWFLLRRG